MTTCVVLRTRCVALKVGCNELSYYKFILLDLLELIFLRSVLLKLQQVCQNVTITTKATFANARISNVNTNRVYHFSKTLIKKVNSVYRENFLTPISFFLHATRPVILLFQVGIF